MQTFVDFIRNVLDPIGVVVGLVVSIPVFWTWWQVVFGEARLRRRWHIEAREQPGIRPAILIVDLLPAKRIAAQVEHFVAQHETLKTIPLDRRFVLVRDETLTPQDMPDFLESLRAIAARIAASGCDVIHCFYAGPTAAAVCVGAEFANAARMLIHQYQEGSYQNFGPIRMLQR